MTPGNFLRGMRKVSIALLVLFPLVLHATLDATVDRFHVLMEPMLVAGFLAMCLAGLVVSLGWGNLRLKRKKSMRSARVMGLFLIPGTVVLAGLLLWSAERFNEVFDQLPAHSFTPSMFLFGQKEIDQAYTMSFPEVFEATEQGSPEAWLTSSWDEKYSSMARGPGIEAEIVDDGKVLLTVPALDHTTCASIASSWPEFPSSYRVPVPVLEARQETLMLISTAMRVNGGTWRSHDEKIPSLEQAREMCEAGGHHRIESAVIQYMLEETEATSGSRL